MTIVLMASQFIACRFCKFFFLFLHECFSIMTAYFTVVTLEYDLESATVLDGLFLFVVFQMGYFTLYFLFEESLTEGLRSAFTVVKLQQENEAIL
mmetsp:Transcript_9934/g.15021  ORF Transcript_9934/g.15021 Transcript_9934/m.15021 type:complete len:95 (+) Transcript_9934:101-385(+)